ncbi:MAG: flavodoxin domain-containing protein [Elusimicrobia bacterium]|nr:flavodoxin domain-containing protein [Elusimicrobiota bacterium]
MSSTKIADNLYWVGAVDWNMRTFHGSTYTTRRGTTYNAFLIIDEKITLVDTVHAPFARELIENISSLVDPSKIDYIIANHVEPDHSGALPELLKLCPKAKVFGTAKCRDGLAKYYGVAMDFQVVKSGDTLSLGKRTLSFLEAAMIHWPDSMFTYIVEDQVLMPNDAFGQHYATAFRFDDEVDPAALREEASKYYANILWPFGTVIAAKIKEIQKRAIPIKMIAPSHGVIWRKNPAKIIEQYGAWAQDTMKNKVVIFYETMWGSTEKMARKILDGVLSEGVEAMVWDISKIDRTDMVNEMLDAKGYLIGSSTHDNDMLPLMAGFLEFFKGLKPKKRIAAVFGSYGWGGGAIAGMEKVLRSAGVEIVLPSQGIQFAPTADELNASYQFGKEFARKIIQQKSS